MQKKTNLDKVRRFYCIWKYLELNWKLVQNTPKFLPGVKTGVPGELRIVRAMAVKTGVHRHRPSNHWSKQHHYLPFIPIKQFKLRSHQNINYLTWHVQSLLLSVQICLVTSEISLCHLQVNLELNVGMFLGFRTMN